MNKQQKKVLNQQPSAYRSMQMAKMGLSKPVKKSQKGALQRWTSEDWLNLNALLLNPPQELPCGKKYRGQTDKTVCRPKKRISQSKTPSPLAYELTPAQIRKAIFLKNQGKRIDWKNI
jgi:hypothetical protein